MRLVILHSNDIHGDFAWTDKNGVRTGGLAYLSGLVRKIRLEEEQVIYAIAGDLFMGSIIDSEYRGLSTIKLANVLEPDVFAVGNHEVDYGLSHLLFLEKCSGFPIVCANMYIKELNRRLFIPSVDILRGNVTVRFIGLLTESVADHIRQEELIDSAVSVRPVRKELEKYFADTEDFPADITILLNHLGIEEDKLLAEALPPGHPVDLIIGGHSHSFLEVPVEVAGIPIVQAGFGSGQLGRIDLDWDDEKRRIAAMSWSLLPVNEQMAESDPLMEFYTGRFQEETDRKYDKVLFTTPCAYTHPWFHRETQLLDLFTDIFREIFDTDLFLLSSNYLRTKTLGPAVTRRDIMIAIPYDNEIFRLTMTGERLERVIRHFLRQEAWEGTNIFLLFSGTLKVRVPLDHSRILSMTLFDKEIDREAVYSVGVNTYIYRNRTPFLGIAEEEMGESVRCSRLSVNDKESLEGYFAQHDTFVLRNAGRLFVEGDPRQLTE